VVDADHLDGDVVGAGFDMSVKFLGDRVRAAPVHQVVDDAVAAAVADVLFGVAQPTELGEVVRAARIQIDAQVLARQRAGLVWVGLEQYRVLDTQERVRPEDLPSTLGVRHVDVIGVGAGRAVAGQLEHLRSVRGQDPECPQVQIVNAAHISKYRGISI
jgi:hypothetical protein